MKLILSINQEARAERYLGLSRKKAFDYIKQKVWARFQGWQESYYLRKGRGFL